jgi:hypothetical protein
MTKRASWLVSVGLLLAVCQVTAGEERFRVEVTAGWPGFRLADEASPPADVHDPGFSLQEVSTTAAIGRFEGFLTWDGGLEETTHWSSSGTPGDGYGMDESLATSAVDLGAAYPLRLGAKTALRPLLGLTHVHRQATRRNVFAQGGLLLQDETLAYRFGGWGLLAGCELTWEPVSRVRVVARALQRWVAGSSTSEYSGRSAIVDWATQEVVGYDERSNSLTVKDSIMVVGGDGGLGVRLGGSVWAEGGWRYRGWGYAASPGAWQGPYVSVSATF